MILGSRNSLYSKQCLILCFQCVKSTFDGENVLT